MRKIDEKLNLILKQYIDDEVERLSTNIISKAISDTMVTYEKEELIILDKNDSNNFTYDTLKLNKIQNSVVKNIQLKLSELDRGSIDDFFLLNKVNYKRYSKVKEGILCEVSMGSINNSLLFTNIGPTIPIRLYFSSQFTTDIEIETKEYGINNIMVTFFLKVNLKEQINMPLTSKSKNVVLREPISVEIIKGEVPNYYNRY